MHIVVVVIAVGLVLFWIGSSIRSSLAIPRREDVVPALLEARKVTQQRPTEPGQVRWALRTSLDQFYAR